MISPTVRPALFLLFFLLIASCRTGVGTSYSPQEEAAVVAGVEDTEPMVQTGPVEEPEEWADEVDDSNWVDETLAGMSLPAKVGQMIMPWVSGDYAPEGSAGFDRINQMIDDLEIGGLIVSTGTPIDVAVKLNLYQERSDLPLLVAADLETGAGFRLRGAVFLPGGTDLGGASDFPSLMALGASGDRYLAYEMGRITAEEARGVGIHVPFAPVLDVNSNPQNPIINTRSFGEDPEAVAGLGMCFVRGIQDHSAIATGKHFPGHGDTDTDSHLALPIIRSGRDRLDRIELLPFRQAIDAGMGAIMTAHIALPAITEAPNLPSTLSRNVLTGILREEMKFEGLIFTDAMDMAAIDALYSREEAAARAVEAGADILLMPPDPARAVRGVMDAVLAGRISETRIDQSVRRILAAKAELGLHEERKVSAEGVHRRVGIPSNIAVAQEVANRSLTLLRNERNLLPLAGTPGANVLSVTYRRANDLLGGRTFDARLRQTYTSLQTATIGADTPRETYQTLTDLAGRADLVVISLHITAVSYAGTIAAPPELVAFINAVSQSGRPNVVVSFGNPYLLNDFPGVQSYLLAWDGAEVSQRAAARALLGEIGVQGRTPIRIPPSFEIGSGITLAPRGQGSVSTSGGGGCG